MAVKEEVVPFLKALQNRIIAAFEKIEAGATFERKEWEYTKGNGGGEMAVLRGRVFEKAAVNWSGVGGDHFPMDDSSGKFFATGISIITHMCNPRAPTVHMNIRFIETEKKTWLGGGYDLTPMGFPNTQDAKHFHATAQAALDAVDVKLYPAFSEAAKKYFFIPHRHKERGQGGIFFDHFSSGDWVKDVGMWRAVGESFLPAIIPIYERTIDEPFSAADRQVQLQARAHYVEFNLLYDRGTKFGFQSQGNIEAILCSLPPLVSW